MKSKGEILKAVSEALHSGNYETRIDTGADAVYVKTTALDGRELIELVNLATRGTGREISVGVGRPWYPLERCLKVEVLG